MGNFNDIISGNTPVLVDFYAEWCGPCKMMPPVLQEVKNQLGDKVHVIKIDIDKNPQVSEVYRIQAVPTVMIFQNGKAVWRQSGVVPAKDLIGILEKF
jgi:thioredoxin 1